MTDVISYLFYPAVCAGIFWCNMPLFKRKNGALTAFFLMICELGVMFGSWLLSIRYGHAVWILPACNAAALVIPFGVAFLMRQSHAHRISGIRGGISMGAWGVLSTLLALGINFC